MKKYIIFCLVLILCLLSVSIIYRYDYFISENNNRKVIAGNKTETDKITESDVETKTGNESEEPLINLTEFQKEQINLFNEDLKARGFNNNMINDLLAKGIIRSAKGSLPENIGTQKQWYEALEKITSDESLSDYKHKNGGSIYSIGSTLDGYIEISHTNENIEIVDSEDNKIYELFKEIAAKYGYDDVPIVFVPKKAREIDFF